MGNTCFQGQGGQEGGTKSQAAASIQRDGGGDNSAAAAAAGAADVPLERPVYARKMSALSAEALGQLHTYDGQIAAMQGQVTAFRARCAAGDAGPDELVAIKNQLAALNGQLDKLQFQGIDSVVTGPLTSGKEQARAQRKGLNKAAAALSRDIKELHKQLAAALAAGAKAAAAPTEGSEPVVART